MVKAIDVVSTMDCSNKNDIPRQEWQSLLGFEMVTAQCSNCYAAAKTPILYSCRLQEHQILEIDECPLCPVPPNIWWRLNPLQMNIKELQNIKNSKNRENLQPDSGLGCNISDTIFSDRPCWDLLDPNFWYFFKLPIDGNLRVALLCTKRAHFGPATPTLEAQLACSQRCTIAKNPTRDFKSPRSPARVKRTFGIEQRVHSLQLHRKTFGAMCSQN